MPDIDQKSPDEPAESAEEEAQEAAFLATDWVRILLVATIGLLLFATLLLVLSGSGDGAAAVMIVCALTKRDGWGKLAARCG